MTLLATGCGKPWPRWKPIATERAGDLRQVDLVIPEADAFWSRLESKDGTYAITGLSETFYAGVGTLRLIVTQNRVMLDALTSYRRQPSAIPAGSVAEIWVSPTGTSARWRLRANENTWAWNVGEDPREIRLPAGRRVAMQAIALNTSRPSLEVFIQSPERWSVEEVREVFETISRRWHVKQMKVTIQLDTYFSVPVFDPFSSPFPVAVEDYLKAPVTSCETLFQPEFRCSATPWISTVRMGILAIPAMMREREQNGEKLFLNGPAGHLWRK